MSEPDVEDTGQDKRLVSGFVDLSAEVGVDAFAYLSTGGSILERAEGVALPGTTGGDVVDAIVKNDKGGVVWHTWLQGDAEGSVGLNGFAEATARVDKATEYCC